MGTTLHAIVEKNWANTGQWDVLSEWHLDKDYELMAKLDQSPHENGWPLDISFRAKYLVDRDTSNCRQKFRVAQLPIPPKSELARLMQMSSQVLTIDISEAYVSMLASLTILESLNLVRVLFYRL